MFWKRKAKLPDANVQPGWVKREEWRTWGAPSNHIAGEASYVRELQALVGARCEHGYCVFVPVVLTREPDNRYDELAVRAEVEGVLVGYLRRQIVEQLAPLLDRAGCPSFTVCGVVRGGSPGAPNLGVHVWLGQRLSPGPGIVIEDDPWLAPWPPSGREVTALLGGLPSSR